jgi:hypothetical protein
MTISPNTAPGTEIVCINDDKYAFTNPEITYCGALDGLERGKIYTVLEIIKDDFFIREEIGFPYLVVLKEIKRSYNRRGFALERFRYVDPVVYELEQIVGQPYEEKWVKHEIVQRV